MICVPREMWGRGEGWDCCLLTVCVRCQTINGVLLQFGVLLAHCVAGIGGVCR